MPDEATLTVEVKPSDALLAITDEAEAAGAGSTGGGGRKNMAGRMNKMTKAGTKMVKAGLKAGGVNFSLGSLLKQAQIFTGFFGSLFQILGGFLDVLLAPLIPILMPILMFLARMIPVVGKLAQIVLGPVVFIIALVMKAILWVQTIIWGFIEDHLDNIMERFDAVKDKFEEAWGYLKNGEIWEAAKLAGQALWDLVTIPFTAGWDTLSDNIASAWDWLLQFDMVKDMRDWWNNVWAQTFIPWVATVWNPIIDILQWLQDKAVVGLNAVITKFGGDAMVSGSLDKWKMKTSVREPVTPQPGEPGWRPGNVTINLVGVPPQVRAELDRDQSDKNMKEVGGQVNTERGFN